MVVSAQGVVGSPSTSPRRYPVEFEEEEGAWHLLRTRHHAKTGCLLFCVKSTITWWGVRITVRGSKQKESRVVFFREFKIIDPAFALASNEHLNRLESGSLTHSQRPSSRSI